MINSVLSGLLILIGAVWAQYGFNRLWQQGFMEDAQEAMAAADALGLVQQPSRYRARVVYVGTVNATPVRVEWRGGLRGAHTVLVQQQVRRSVDVITSPAELYDLLGVNPDEAVKA